MGLFDGWGNMGGMEDMATNQSPGLMDIVSRLSNNDRALAGLGAFGRALAQAGAPRRGPITWGGAISDAFEGLNTGRKGYDDDQLKKMMQKLQMQTASLQQKKLQGEVDGTGAYTLPAGAVRMQGGQVIGEAPFKPLPEPKPQKSPLELAISMRESLPIGSPQRQIWDDQIRKLNFVPQDARPAPAEPTPQWRSIIDPTNPKQMIDVDARKYSGGGLGSPGVLGVAGKEPNAAKREEQVGSGREMVSNVIADLRNYYKNLSDEGGITDPNKNAAENVAAWASSSAAGQAVGNMIGTKNQSQRNSIAMARPLLMQAIMKASGMSAKQMDSNVELKMWIATATDPKLDKPANDKALDRLDRMYGLSEGGELPPTNSASGKIKRYVETRVLPDGRKIGLKADGTKEIINE